VTIYAYSLFGRVERVYGPFDVAQAISAKAGEAASLGVIPDSHRAGAGVLCNERETQLALPAALPGHDTSCYPHPVKGQLYRFRGGHGRDTAVFT